MLCICRFAMVKIRIFDYNSSYVWGNINTQTLREIFTSETRQNFLNKVIFDEYISMCDGCPR